MKPNLLKGLAAVGAVLALTSCADNTQTASLLNDGAQCFKPNDVVAYNQLTDTSFVVHTLRGKVFSADLPACRGIDFAQTVGLRPIRNSQICDGDQGTLITSDPGGHQMTCGAFSFHELSAAEVAMLPKSAQP